MEKYVFLFFLGFFFVFPWFFFVFLNRIFHKGRISNNTLQISLTPSKNPSLVDFLCVDPRYIGKNKQQITKTNNN